MVNFNGANRDINRLCLLSGLGDKGKNNISVQDMDRDEKESISRADHSVLPLSRKGLKRRAVSHPNKVCFVFPAQVLQFVALQRPTHFSNMNITFTYTFN